MNEYRFYLYHRDIGKWTLIKDPIGWDELGKIIRRYGQGNIGQKWHGIFFEYQTKLGFVKDGKKFIQYFYEKYKIEQDILLRITKRDTRTRQFLTEYEGRLNLTTYKIGTTKVECNVEQTGFLQKLKNRKDVKVNLSSLKTLGGLELPVEPGFALNLHSKVLRKSLKLVPPGNSYTYDDMGNGTYYLISDYNTEVDELGGLIDNSIQISTLDPLENSKYLFIADEAGTYEFDIDIDGGILRSGSPGPETYNIQWKLVYGRAGNYTTVNIGTAYNASAGFFNKSLNTSINLSVNDEVYLYAPMVVSGIPGGFLFDVEFISYGGSTGKVEVTADTTVHPTSSGAVMIYEAMERVLQSITDTSAPLYSKYLGRTDLGYDEDGAGALAAVTNGQKIRGNTDAIHCSLSDLIDTLFAIDGEMGIGIEKINGAERVRIEPMPFWYNATRMMRLDFVRDIEKEVVSELYFNEIEAGADKWNNEKINNLDEFNTQKDFVTPITQIKNKLSIKSPYVTSGYSIEFTRRERIQPTKDSKRDNDNFIIKVRRDGGTFVPEKDEDFASVSGVISPETSYNLKYSPARCLRTHGRLLRASLDTYKDQSIQFSFGQANNNLVSQLTSETASIAENADILIGSLPKPLFFAEMYTVRAKLTRAQLIALSNTNPDEPNVFGYIEFSKTDRQYMRGYLLSARPSAKHNEAILTLLKANL